ncbi:hypothetical protein GCM10025794_37050 [Massilia kyonggiensis]
MRADKIAGLRPVISELVMARKASFTVREVEWIYRAVCERIRYKGVSNLDKGGC